MENQNNKFNNILFFITFLYPRLQKLEVDNHVIAIYNNQEEKFNEAFEFLKNGILRNEVYMIITEELTKEVIIKEMRKLGYKKY
jgi:hypothetical protein